MISYTATIKKLDVGYEMEIIFPELGYKCGMTIEQDSFGVRRSLINQIRHTVCLMDQIGPYNYHRWVDLGEYCNPALIKLHWKYNKYKPVFTDI